MSFWLKNTYKVLKIYLSYYPNFLLLGIYLKIVEVRIWKRYQHRNAHLSIIQNSQNVEAMQITING